MRGSRPPRGPAHRLFHGLVLAALLAGCGSSADPQDLLIRARAALSAGDYEQAEQLAVRVPADSREWTSALAVAAEAAAKASRVDDAVRQYQALAEQQRKSSIPPLGLFYAAEILRDAGRLSEAETLYRDFLEHEPYHALTHERLAFLKSVSGRRWEAIPHYLALIRSGSVSLEELVLLADLDRPVEQGPYLDACQRKARDDQLVEMGLAAHAFWEGRTDEARRRLRRVVAAWPEAAASQAMLGELLVAHAEAPYLDWQRRLPPSADEDPDIWFVRGLWARRKERTELATRCFWEALRRAPTHRRATFQLAQVLRLLGHRSEPEVQDRSRDMAELSQLLDEVLRTGGKREEPLQQATVLLERMGRLWEAAAWAGLADTQFPASRWPGSILARLRGKLSESVPLVASSSDFGHRLDFSNIRDSVVPEPKVVSAARPRSENGPREIRFEELAEGLPFVYENGADPSTPGARTFEQTGGGVAVLDLDGDLLPDLFLPQGGAWPTGRPDPPENVTATDRLLRNVAGKPVNVTRNAALVDHGFGQGAAVGDYDNDGFPDLYVANVGRNQLLRNNGDGTFADVTDAAGLDTVEWTVSCAVVDLNADSLPDLYEVNYLTGAGLYELICEGKACSPRVFEGAPDSLHVNRGNGNFQRLPAQSPEVDGKGLGLVAFRCGQDDRPALFIANDQVPNFLLRSVSTDSGLDNRYRDEAFVGGVALNQEGLALASMGIAADDLDGNGRLDFHVTTFIHESSLLLMQEAEASFTDRAATAGLRAPTGLYVGWGTQALDADRDGHPDLVAVNGHVDDYRDKAGAYHMPSQFFRNLGSARFEDQSENAGAFFQEKRLGRGLARLDWNADGLTDFAVSNMGQPASLVLNRTRNAGHFVSVRLIGTTSSRDALGSEVEVEAGSASWRKQLVGGDGYMASNERLLQFGLGEAAEVSGVVVRWPSGSRSTLSNLPADATLQIVESTAEALLWSARHPPRIVAVTVEDSDADPRGLSGRERARDSH